MIRTRGNQILAKQRNYWTGSQKSHLERGCHLWWVISRTAFWMKKKGKGLNENESKLACIVWSALLYVVHSFHYYHSLSYLEILATCHCWRIYQLFFIIVCLISKTTTFLLDISNIFLYHSSGTELLMVKNCIFVFFPFFFFFNI